MSSMVQAEASATKECRSPSAGSMISSRSPILLGSPTSATAQFCFDVQDAPKQPSPSSPSALYTTHYRSLALVSPSSGARQSEKEQASPLASSPATSASPFQREAKSPRSATQSLAKQPTPAIVHKFRDIDQLRLEREHARRGLLFAMPWDDASSGQQMQQTQTQTQTQAKTQGMRKAKASLSAAVSPVSSEEKEEPSRQTNNNRLPAAHSPAASLSELPPKSSEKGDEAKTSKTANIGWYSTLSARVALATALAALIIAVVFSLLSSSSSSSLSSASLPSLVRSLLGVGGTGQDHPHLERLLSVANNASRALDASDVARLAERFRKDYGILGFHLRQITDHPLGPDQARVHAVRESINGLLPLAEASEAAIVRVASLHKTFARILDALRASASEGLPYALSTHVERLVDSARLAEQAMQTLQQHILSAHDNSRKSSSQIATQALKSPHGLLQQNAELYTLALAHHLVLASLAADLGGAPLSVSHEEQAIAKLTALAAEEGWTKDGFHLRAATEYRAMLSFHRLAAGPRAVMRLHSELSALRTHIEALHAKAIQEPTLTLGVSGLLARRAAAQKEEHVLADQRCELLLDGLAEEGRMITL